MAFRDDHLTNEHIDPIAGRAVSESPTVRDVG